MCDIHLYVLNGCSQEFCKIKSHFRCIPVFTWAECHTYNKLHLWSLGPHCHLALIIFIPVSPPPSDSTSCHHFCWVLWQELHTPTVYSCIAGLRVDFPRACFDFDQPDRHVSQRVVQSRRKAAVALVPDNMISVYTVALLCVWRKSQLAN